MPKLAAFSVALLALAACDSSAPPPDELVGTWATASITHQQIATVSRAQDAIDLTRPSVGSLEVSGAETGEVSFLHGYYRYGTASTLYLASWDIASPTYPPVRYVVTLEDFPDASRVSAQKQDDLSGFYPTYSADGPPGLRRGPTYTVARTLDAIYGGDPTRVEGAFTLGHQRLVAGRPAVVGSARYEFPPASTVRYVIEADGTLRVQEVQGHRVTERVGTWARTGDRVVLSTTVDDVTTRLEYAVMWEDDALALVVDQEVYPCVLDCLRYGEGQFGLEPGTLTALRTEEVYRFAAVAAPAPPVASVRAGVVAETGPALPAPVRARLTVAPTPAR